MSKKSKKQAQEKRRSEKAKRKAANKAAYASLVGTSENKKKMKRRTGGFSVEKHEHLVSNCGNPGCKKCFPQYSRTR